MSSSLIRKRPVSFGNPALGTYYGFVHTVQQHLHPQPLVEGAIAARRWVAMVDVPPHQVPEGILSLTAPHRKWMEHMRIVMEEQESEEHEDPPADRTYLVLISLSTEEAAATMVEDLHGQPYTSLDETVCCSMHAVVALQGVAGVSLTSPFFAPNDKLHADEYNCAVCLDPVECKADDSSNDQQQAAILTTVCNHSFHLNCLLRWQDSPCPVCRYDHSGLNEALSQCHACGPTTTTTTATAAPTGGGGDTQHRTTTSGRWLCLLCGLVSCSEHSRQHYDTTLHAYALNTETQHVWDFAGQGYVHRLLQNKEDGKLVEVNDPTSVSQERSSRPGLSQAQEGEVVHRKLEGFASQYYTLLKSQLEQQRIYYEGRLEEIRREYTENERSSTEDLIIALKQERHQLGEQLASLRSRSSKVHDDLSFVLHLNEGLEANREPLRRQVEQAQLDRVEQRQMLEASLPPLQEKVTRLMLQLENAMTGATTTTEEADGKPKAR